MKKKANMFSNGYKLLGYRVRDSETLMYVVKVGKDLRTTNTQVPKPMSFAEASEILVAWRQRGWSGQIDPVYSNTVKTWV